VNVSVNANANVNAPSATTPPATTSTIKALDPRRLHFRLGAGALVALGSSPGVAFGFTIQAGIRRPRWSFNLEGRADLPSGEPAAGGSVTTALYTGSAIPCFHQGVFAGCAIAMLGAQISEGHGFAVNAQAKNLFAAGGVRAALEIGLPYRLELQVHADLLAAITRTTLEADQTVVFRTPPVQGAFHLALLGYFR
jgi:hypothetical protein